MAVSVRCSADDDIFGSWGRALLEPAAASLASCAGPARASEAIRHALGDDATLEVFAGFVEQHLSGAAAAVADTKAREEEQRTETLRASDIVASRVATETVAGLEAVDVCSAMDRGRGARARCRRRRKAQVQRLRKRMCMGALSAFAVELRFEGYAQQSDEHATWATEEEVAGECALCDDSMIAMPSSTAPPSIDTEDGERQMCSAGVDYGTRECGESCNVAMDSDMCLDEPFGALCDAADAFDASFVGARVYHGKWRRPGKKQWRMRVGKETRVRHGQVHRYTTDAAVGGGAVSATAAATARPHGQYARATAAVSAEQQQVERAIAASVASFAVATANTVDAEIGLSWAQIQALQERDLTPEDYELLLALDDRVEKKTIGAEAVQSIACAAVSVADLAEGGFLWDAAEGPLSCRVCLGEYEEGETIKTLPCSHTFHAACIDQWLTNASVTCPLDGTSLEGLL